MLSGANLIAFGAISDAVRAREFYCGMLGLHATEETEFALVLNANGVELRLQKVESVTVAPYTHLGWYVETIEPAARQLRQKNIDLIRYPFLEQDELGIWTAPDGVRVLWFKDPDGNVLSLTQAQSVAS